MSKVEAINTIIPSLGTNKINAENTDIKHVNFDMPNDSVKLPDIKNQSIIQMQKLSNFLSNDRETESVIKDFDFEQFGTKGLPLKYSRRQFREDLNEELNSLTDTERLRIMSRFNIKRGDYDIEGMPDLSEYDKKSFSKITEKSEEIYETLDKFLNKNEVLIDNKEEKEVLDNLIQGFPEFTSIAQKKQHPTHDYSVDIHTLKVLQDSMKDPLYETLSDEGKTVLKLSVLMHDLGKKAEVIDTGHQYLSTDYSRGILKRFDLPQPTKKRITNTIKNHHWFKEYNNDVIGADDVLKDCKSYEDFTIYKIFAKADFKNVSKNFMCDVTNTKNEEEYNKYMDERFEVLDFVAHHKFGVNI